MPSLSKILLPLDFSDRSVAALGCARTLAERFRSEITVVHVLPPVQFELNALGTSGSMLADLYRGRAGQAASDLDRLVKAKLGGLTVKQAVLEGEPAEVVIGLANDGDVDLIVMPTHGYGQFRRFILGSNTAKVLHDADCAVWTGVHMESAPAAAAPPRNVVCGVDLGPQSPKALAWAAMLASEFGARLTLMHATGAAPDNGAGAEWREAVREAAERELVRLQRAANVDAELAIAAGDAPEALCAAVDRLRADVLVIGRGSAAGVYGRLRTNAYAIIRQSSCPVVSV